MGREWEVAPEPCLHVNCVYSLGSCPVSLYGCMLNYCITSWLKTYGYPTVLSNRLLFLCLYDFGSRLVVPCLFMCFKFRSCCLGYSKPVPRNTHNYLYNIIFPINRFLKTSLFLPLSEQTKNSQNHINPKTTRSNKSHMFTL